MHTHIGWESNATRQLMGGGGGAEKPKNWPSCITLPQVSFFSEINTAILYVNLKKKNVNKKKQKKKQKQKMKWNKQKHKQHIFLRIKKKKKKNPNFKADWLYIKDYMLLFNSY